MLLALPHSGDMSLRLKPRQMASAPASIACPQDLVGTKSGSLLVSHRPLARRSRAHIFSFLGWG